MRKIHPFLWIFYQDTESCNTKHVREFFKNMVARIYTENLFDKIFFAITFIGLIVFTLAYISTLKYFAYF